MSVLRISTDGAWDLTIRDLTAVATDFPREARRLLSDLGAQQRGAIEKRVMSGGVGADGRSYPKSKKTATYGGTTLVGQGRSAGHMIADMTTMNNTGTSIEVGWTSAAEKRKALFANEGTREHRISAKAGGVLAWKSPTGRTAGGRLKSDTRFAAYVNHPGTPPRPFFGVSMDEEQALVTRTEKWRDDLLKGRNL